MSSFKRRVASTQPSLHSGTRILPGSHSTIITSTGIPSLDDILGGGLPLSCSLLVLAPDPHSAYGELVQKYFAAQGLASGHKVCIVDDDARDFVAGCMWMPKESSAGPSTSAQDDDDLKADEHDSKIKIAWRYENMKQFQTTVPTSNQSAEDYCRVFDLTSRLPDAVIQSAIDSGHLIHIPVSASSADSPPTIAVLTRLERVLEAHTRSSDAPGPVRICIPFLGSSQWGDVTSQELYQYLFSMRRILRRYPWACVTISMPSYLCTDSWGGQGWIHKLGWLCDACISLAAFTADPSLAAMFSSHHGLVHIHSLPAPHSLLPPSDRFSTLRGLSSSGENNLAFKCMRKRFIFETLHLDVEGGVGERRTTPSSGALAHDDAGTTVHPHPVPAIPRNIPAAGGAAVQVELEKVQATVAQMMITEGDAEKEEVAKVKKPKAKKKVAFMSDRPDIYDF